MHLRRLLTGAAALLLLAAPAAAVTPGETERGVGLRLLEAPTERRDDPRARVSIVDHVSPGEVVQRRLEVSDDTDRPLEVEVYVGSATVRGGQFVGDDGRGTGDLARWSTVTPSPVRVAARGTAVVTVRIAVPEDAAPGERYGVIWAQPPSGTTGGVTQVNRIGVRVYLSVGPGGEPPSDFAVRSLTAARDEQGRPVVEATVSNTGGRAIDMSGTLRLEDGPGGLSAGPFPVELGRTLGIGESAPVRVALDRALPAGPWRATLLLRSGVLERAAEARITFPEDAGQRAAPVRATALSPAEDPTIVIPVAVGLLGLAALLLVLALLRSRLSRAR